MSFTLPLSFLFYLDLNFHPIKKQRHNGTLGVIYVRVLYKTNEWTVPA